MKLSDSSIFLCIWQISWGLRSSVSNAVEHTRCCATWGGTWNGNAEENGSLPVTTAATVSLRRRACNDTWSRFIRSTLPRRRNLKNTLFKPSNRARRNSVAKFYLSCEANPSVDCSRSSIRFQSIGRKKRERERERERKKEWENERLSEWICSSIAKSTCIWKKPRPLTKETVFTSRRSHYRESGSTVEDWLKDRPGDVASSKRQPWQVITNLHPRIRRYCAKDYRNTRKRLQIAPCLMVRIS